MQKDISSVFFKEIEIRPNEYISFHMDELWFQDYASLDNSLKLFSDFVYSLNREILEEYIPILSIITGNGEAFHLFKWIKDLNLSFFPEPPSIGLMPKKLRLIPERWENYRYTLLKKDIYLPENYVAQFCLYRNESDIEENIAEYSESLLVQYFGA